MRNRSPHFFNDEVTRIHAMGRLLKDATLRRRLDRDEAGTGSHSFRSRGGQVFSGIPLP
jgi:hypothetical protein